MMEALASASTLDWILLLVGFEAAGVAALRWLTGRGPAPLPFFATQLAGVFLLLALRCALSGSSATWILICLAGALVAHFADLAQRWESPPARRAVETRPAMRATLSLRVSPAQAQKAQGYKSSHPNARRARNERSSDA